MKTVMTLVGWVGAISILWAYYLVSIGRAEQKKKTYLWLNIIGSVLLIVNTFYLEAYPSAFVNVVWLVIAFWGMFKEK